MGRHGDGSFVLIKGIVSGNINIGVIKMSRNPRKKSKSGYYHVMLRGNEKKNIFNNDEDKIRFIETIYEKKQENRFLLHALCLMDNHIHLMLSEENEDIAKIMKRITVSYVHYFNKKYKRVGHLFQDRYKSEVVEEDSYILSLARYIHQNPVKAGIVKNAGDYKWSSFNGYLYNDDYLSKILDRNMVLGLFSSRPELAQKAFKEFMNEAGNEIFIEDTEAAMDEEEARIIFEDMLIKKGLKTNGDTETQIPNEIIKDFKDKTKLSIRKIAAITGINKDKVNKIINT
jgi:REP element-mobilizing transposase RayT